MRRSPAGKAAARPCPTMNSRYQAPNLVAFARALLAAAGLEKDKADTVASVLVEGDLLGHTTHGLQMLSAYLGELEKGMMAKAGEPLGVADYPAAVTRSEEHTS